MPEQLMEGITRRKNMWSRWREDVKKAYDMRDMVDKNAIPGYESTVISDARAGFNLAKHTLSRNQPRHNAPGQRPSDVEQRTEEGMSERFLNGLYRINDEALFAQGRSPLTTILADWMLGTGRFDVFVDVYMGDDGILHFEADPRDPNEVFPEWGGIRDGLIAVDAQIHLTRGELRDKAEQEKWKLPRSLVTQSNEKDPIIIVDHWESIYDTKNPKQRQIWNAITLGVSGTEATSTDKGMVISPMQHLKKRIRIPYFSGMVGGMETSSVVYTDVPSAMARRGQNILITPSAAFAALNRTETFALQDLKEEIQRTLLHISQGAQGGITEEDMGKIVNMDLTESLVELARQRYGADFQNTRAAHQNYFQRAMFPWTQFGQTDLELSGIAIERLNEAAKGIVGPSQRAMERLLASIDLHWLQEFKRLEGPPIRLAGSLSGSSMNTALYDEDFEFEKLPDSLYFNVKVPLALPSDIIMKMNIARMAKPQGPIVDDLWILEMLEVADPELVIRRRNEDEANQNPFVLLSDALVRLGQMLAQAREDKDEIRIFGIEKAMEFMAQQAGNIPLPGITAGAGAEPEQGLFPQVGSNGAGRGQQRAARPAARPVTQAPPGG